MDDRWLSFGLNKWILKICILIASISNASSLNIEKIDHVFHYIDNMYVEGPPSDHTESALSGILQGLDKHSSYLSIRDAEFLKMLTQGGFVGIGVSVKLNNQKLIITAVLPNSPASETSIQPGNIITHIDDTPVDPNNILTNISLIRGPINSVTQIRLEGVKKAIPVIRKKIDLQEIQYNKMPNNLGYIKINLFNQDTLQELKYALTHLADTEALIIDLRTNPGGLLFSSIQATALFLDTKEYPGGDITHVVSRHDHVQIPLPKDTLDQSHHKPIYILTSSATASGAEIFAATLKHYKRATLIGTTTNGKGTIQTLLPLDDGSMIKLTTAYFTTPSGSTINGVGVVPHYEILPNDPALLPKVVKIIRHNLNSTETYP